MNKLTRLLRHRWMDVSDTRRAVPDDMAQRLAAQVAASELRHTGQVRLCVESALPTSYVWRIRGDTGVGEVVRQRALAWFGRLRVWDTERNNGVLIYVLLAERAIELVADRAVARCISPAQWKSLADGLGAHLRAGDVESGLAQALGDVTAVLAAHFPCEEPAGLRNELPDAVVRV